MEVSKQFLGSITATSFSDPRAEVLFMDAAEYMKGHQAEFDVIIVDSSDPVGPAESLYTSDFYRNMYNALRPNGIVCTQGECMWLHLDLIHKVMSDAKGLYPVVDYGYSCVPTYPDGQIGFIIASKSNDGAWRPRGARCSPRGAAAAACWRGALACPACSLTESTPPPPPPPAAAQPSPCASPSALCPRP